MAINSLSASSNGLSGLVSGMDTQSIVDKMLSGTQAKIDKTLQRKTVLQYKQSMYRDVSTKLRTLQNSFLSFTSTTNLRSSAFYNTMKATLTPPSGASAAFSVSASSGAKTGNATMNYVKQLATARTEKTTRFASSPVAGRFDQAAAQQLLGEYRGEDAVLSIRVGDKTLRIADAPMTLGGMSQTEVVDYLNGQFQDPQYTIEAEARFVNNRLEIVARDPDDFITVSGNTNVSSTNGTLAMRMFGTGNVTMSAQGTFSSAIDADAYQPSFTVDLDGRKQTLYVDLQQLQAFANAPDAAAAATAQQAIADDIQDQLRRAFGVGVSAGISAGQLTFTAGSPSQKFTIEGDAGVMGTFGIKSGLSNKLNANLALKDLNFATQLSGNQHTFSINGVQFSYDAKTQLSTVLNDINNSKAGVTVSYSESDDTFVVKASATGAGGMDFKTESMEGNLMSVLFGAQGGASATGYSINQDMVAGSVANPADYTGGGVYTFDVNGTKYKFTINKKAGETITASSFAEKMNIAFRDTFGYMADGTQAVRFMLNNEGKFTVRANDPQYIVKTVAQHKDTNMSLLGFAEGQASVAQDGGVTLAQVGASFGGGGGVSFQVGAGMFTMDGSAISDATTLDELAAMMTEKMRTELGLAPGDDAPRVAFDAISGAFKLTGYKADGVNDTPVSVSIYGAAGDDSLDKLFGQRALEVSQEARTNATTVTDVGRNAVFSLNGDEMERASNTFTIDGLTYTLHDATHTSKNLKTGLDASTMTAEELADHTNYDYTYQGATQISTTRDSEKVVEGMMEFLKLYNETINYINELYTADATYKDYAPLGDKQKQEMSDREVELWEEKSKEGLLRNDQYLDRVLTSLRTSMYTKPEGSTIAIYDLGITTSFYGSDGNFNPESEADLRAYIESNAEAVQQLFSGEGGIMELVNDALTNATRSSYASPGYLVQVAGSGALDTTSTLYRQITQIDDQLTSLEDRYWSEYNRYWKQFNQMENLISKMNSQSGYLAQMSGGG